MVRDARSATQRTVIDGTRGPDKAPGAPLGAPAEPLPGATILVDVSDWAAPLRAEYEEIIRARLGAPLSADELAEWLKAVERRNRALRGGDLDDPDAAQASAGLLERAVTVPGTRVRLLPPTIAARIRMDNAWREVQAGRMERDAYVRCAAYCMAHGLSRERIAELADRRCADRAVAAWAAAELTCTAEQLEAACEAVVDGLYPEPDGDADAEPG